MAWQGIELVPGMNAEWTATLNRTGFTLTGLGRFKAGQFQKMGGWTKYYPSLTPGHPRALHAWEDLSINGRLAQASTTGVSVITNGFLQDVTPQTFLSDTTPDFTTTIGSRIITVVDTGVSNITNYDTVFFETPISVDGIILSGLYPVIANITTTSYQIQAQTPALAGVTDGGAVPAFTTISGSSLVTVTFPDHGLTTGDDIVFPISTSVGGVEIVGRQIAQSITDADNFVINAPNLASSSAGPVSMNSGNAEFLYYIAIGPQAKADGYGAGGYGEGGYGTGVAIDGQTGTDIAADDWSLDNFGELLVNCPDGFPIFTWGPESGFKNSSVIATGPAFNTGAFVSIAQQVIVAFGSTVPAKIGVYQDPLLVKWSTVGDITNWVPTVVDQAGDYRLTSGSKIVGGAATPSTDLIWTDLDLWTMSYIGPQFAFGFNKIGSNCGLVAKHAHAQFAGITYWMSSSNFFSLSGGGVQVIPCSVWDAVFQDLDLNNAHLCHAGSNTGFNEILFFYPSISGGLGFCDKCVKLNTLDGSWDYSPNGFQRNAWLDTSVLGGPIASTNDGIIYRQESGNDADGSPLNAFFETGWFYMNEGEDMVMIDRIFPDFIWGDFNQPQTATVQITVRAVKYPGDTPNVYGPFSVTKSKRFISKKMRGRQFQFRVESTDIGSFWRNGHNRVRFKLDGRK